MCHMGAARLRFASVLAHHTGTARLRSASVLAHHTGTARLRSASVLAHRGVHWRTLTYERRWRSTTGSMVTSCCSELGTAFAVRTRPTGMPPGNTAPSRPLVTTTSLFLITVEL